MIKAPLVALFIATVFQPFSSFAIEEGKVYKPTVGVKVLKKSTHSDDGTSLNYPTEDQAEVTTLEVMIPPGAKTGWHTHPFPGYAIVVSGFLEVELDTGEKNIYKPGDVVYEVVNRVHQGKNIGDDPVELITIFTGVKDKAFTVRAEAPSGN